MLEMCARDINVYWCTLAEKLREDANWLSTHFALPINWNTEHHREQKHYGGHWLWVIELKVTANCIIIFRKICFEIVPSIAKRIRNRNCLQIFAYLSFWMVQCEATRVNSNGMQFDRGSQSHAAHIIHAAHSLYTFVCVFVYCAVCIYLGCKHLLSIT